MTRDSGRFIAGSKAGLVAAALLLALIAVPVAGAASNGAYGVHIASTKAKDADQSSALFGGHLELPLGPLGLQGAVDYRSHEAFAADIQGVREGVQVRSVPITLTGKLYLSTVPRLSPYFLGGAGWYRVTYDYSEGLERALDVQDQTVTTFGCHVGAGLQLALSPRVSTYGEARYVFADPQRKLGQEVRREMRNLNYDSSYLGAGINVAL